MPEGSPAEHKVRIRAWSPAVAYRTDNESSTRTERSDKRSAGRGKKWEFKSLSFSLNNVPLRIWTTALLFVLRREDTLSHAVCSPRPFPFSLASCAMIT
jgi:hypothetical protein